MNVYCVCILTVCLLVVVQGQYPGGGGMGGGFDSFGGGGGAYTLSMGSGFGYDGGMPSFSGISLGGFGGGRSGIGGFPEYGQVSQFKIPDYNMGGGMRFGGGSGLSGFGRPFDNDYGMSNFGGSNFGGQMNYQPRVIYS